MTNIRVPAKSAVGYGAGKDVATGQAVYFVGDQRQLRAIGESIRAAKTKDDLPMTTLFAWQIIADPQENELSAK